MCTGAQGGPDDVPRPVRAQEEDFRTGIGSEDCSGGFDAAQRRKLDVEQYHIGAQRVGLLNGLPPVRRLTTYLPRAGAVKQRTNLCPPRSVIVDNENVIGQWSMAKAGWRLCVLHLTPDF